MITGLDPAETLAHEIENVVHQLKGSNESMVRFEFIPDPEQVEKSPNYDGNVVLEFIRDEDAGLNVLTFNRWYSTTYQSRFINVDRTFKQTKFLGQPFALTLEKSREDIRLIDLR